MKDSNKTIEVNDQDNYIDFIAIAKVLWIGRKTIIICLLIGLIIGLIVAFAFPNQYTARTILVPQVKSSSKSSLSSLAALAGLDLGMTESTDLSPLIYPKIVASVPFNLELMNTPFHFQDVDTAVSVYDYYINLKQNTVFGTIVKYTLGLPNQLLSAVRPKPKEIVLPKTIKEIPLYLTKKQLLIKKMFEKKVQLAVEKKEGYLTLSVTMEDPLVAAEMATKAQQMLQDFITEFKVEKSKAELEFIQGRYNIAKEEAEGYQYNMASNQDKYKNLTSNLPQVSNTRLQTKYSIANSVYLELAKQLEQAKIQVKRDTPVFTIVEPVTIPIVKSSLGKSRILVFWIFVSFLIGSCLVYFKQTLRKIKIKWRKA